MLEIAGIALLPDWPVFLGFVARRARAQHRAGRGHDLHHRQRRARRAARRRDRLARRRRGRAGPHPRGGARPVGDPRLLAGGVRRRSNGSARPICCGSPSRCCAAGGRRQDAAARLVGLAAVPGGDAGQHPQSQGRARSSSPSCRNSSIRARRCPALQILCLGLWFDFAGTLVNIAIALAAAGAAARLRHVAWLGRAARWFAATADGRARGAARAQRPPSGVGVGPALLQRLGISRAGVDALQPVGEIADGRGRGRRGARAASSGKLIMMSAAVNSSPANQSRVASSLSSQSRCWPNMLEHGLLAPACRAGRAG